LVGSKVLTLHKPIQTRPRPSLRQGNLKKSALFLCITALGCVLTACGSSSPALSTPSSKVPVNSPVIEPTLSKVPETSLASPTSPLEPQPTATIILPSPTPGPEDWKSAPIIPQLSERARQIFEQGLAQGNDPQRFSKIGDSETFTRWFLAPFDQTPPTYRLGDYTYLQTVIEQFSGSFARQSLAARQGFNAASVFAPLWADPAFCLAGETPLACEFRLHQPSYVFVLLGTNDIYHLEEFEAQMRRILEYSIEQGVLPILGTKADNLEGDGRINRTLYSLALEYEIPLWNFWAAVQDLPQAGLDQDQAHLTFGYNHFDDPKAMLNAWPVRNLTALQVLNAVWRATQP
jgi:hypothetical protein